MGYFGVFWGCFGVQSLLNLTGLHPKLPQTHPKIVPNAPPKYPQNQQRAFFGEGPKIRSLLLARPALFFWCPLLFDADRLRLGQINSAEGRCTKRATPFSLKKSSRAQTLPKARLWRPLRRPWAAFFARLRRAALWRLKAAAARRAHLLTVCNARASHGVCKSP